MNETTNSSTVIKNYISKNDIPGLTKYLNDNKNIIKDLIKSKNHKLLKTIFTTCKFDNEFILNLLLLYKNKTLTFSVLLDLLSKENKKIIITNDMYDLAYKNNNSKALKILFKYEIFTNKNNAIRKIIKYDLIKKSIDTRDVSFIKTILKYKNIDFKYLKYEEILYNLFKKQKNSTSYNKIVRLLIYSMLKNYPSCSYKNTILNIAIRAGNFNISRYLIEYFKHTSKDINSKDINGEYPIIVAMSNKEIDIFDYLLEKGADPNTKNNCGASLLYLTIQLNNIDYIVSLVNDNTRNKIDINALDNSGYTPLIMSYIKQYMDIFYYLIEYSNINQKDKYGHSILYYVIQNNEDDTLVKNLINIGATIDKDVIDIAIEKKRLPMILENDIIDINSYYKNEKSQSLLIASIISDCDRCDIENIIIKGFNVNIQDIDGNTPLIHAVQKRKIETAKLLIEYGAIKNIKNKDGKKALDYLSYPYNSSFYNLLK